MLRRLDEIAELIHARICPFCAQRVEACDAPQPSRCVLFELFPLVVQAILATDSQDLADYQRAIRENVCSVCANATLDLSCELREQVRCALDLHLAEVVEVVRQAAQRPEPAGHAVSD